MSATSVDQVRVQSAALQRGPGPSPGAPPSPGRGAPPRRRRPPNGAPGASCGAAARAVCLCACVCVRGRGAGVARSPRPRRLTRCGAGWGQDGSAGPSAASRGGRRGAPGAAFRGAGGGGADEVGRGGPLGGRSVADEEPGRTPAIHTFSLSSLSPVITTPFVLLQRPKGQGNKGEFEPFSAPCFLMSVACYFETT